MCSWIWFDFDYAQIGKMIKQNKIKEIKKIMMRIVIAFIIALSL